MNKEIELLNHSSFNPNLDKTMQKYALILFILACTNYTLLAQGSSTESEYQLPRIIPPAPDVQQLEKYGEIPVGYYTGTPNIGIDLYQIQTRSGLTIPISLSYHPSGVKVDEKASRVGLGWSLKAEGVISRSVAGIKEFQVTGNRPILGSFDPNDFQNHNADYLYALDVVAGEKDSEPDVFQYNFLGRSGKFIFDETEDIHLIPKEAFDISVNPSAQIMSQFTIVDEMGNTFLFNSMGTSVVGSNCASGGASNYLGNNVSTSWKLTKITTYMGEEIDFIYRTFNYQYILAKEATDYQKVGSAFGCPVKLPENCEKTITHAEPVLDRINFTNGNVQFTYSDDASYPINGSNIRGDFPDNHALRKISISNSYKEIKSYEFVYDYFNASNPSEDTKRLKLEELVETNSTKKHSFEYNESLSLPARFSYSQDLWGFYNGKTNSTILPRMFYDGVVIPGADRSVSTTHCQAGILTKITYPTKGTTEFTYESNDYYLNQTTTEQTAGGFTELADFVNVNQNSHPLDILAGYQNVQITIDNQCGNDPEALVLEDGAIAKIMDGNQELYRFIASGTYDLNLAVGNYTLEFEVDGAGCFFSAVLSWYTEQTILPHNELTGGVRIQKIRNFDGIDYEERTYSYNKANSTESSGYLQGVPQFNYLVNQFNENQNTCVYLGRGHSSVYALATALGNSVGYSRTTEVNNNEAVNGKTVYHFRNDVDQYNGVGIKFPNVPPTSYSWKRGLQERKELFNAVGDTVLVEINDYAFDNSFISESSENYGVDKLAAGFVIRQVQPELFPNKASFAWDSYFITSGWVKPNFKTTITYFPEKVTQTENYFYDNLTHLQRTRTETTNSKNQVLLVENYFPDDVEDKSSLPGGDISNAQVTDISKLKKLGTNPRIAATVQTERTENGKKTTSRTLFSTPDLIVLPDTLKFKKDSGPLEGRLIYHEYDAVGNAKEVSQENGRRISYVWGYNQMYPIAKIENLSYSDMTSLQLSYVTDAQTASDADNDQTVDTFDSGGARIYQGNEGLLREDLEAIRNAFPDALVTTMTYDPLIGVTSMTDPKGYTVYYEYDGFNRLKAVRDQDNNLISDYDYHYKSQP